MCVKPAVIRLFLTVFYYVTRHCPALYEQLAAVVNFILNSVHRKSDRAGIQQLFTAPELDRGNADFGHSVAVRKAVADGVEKFKNFRADVAAAGYHKLNALAEHILADFLKRKL